MEGRNNSEAARLAGVDHSLISRWRAGHTPVRLQESTRRRLEAVVGSATAANVSAAVAEAEVTRYALSTLRMIERQAQAIVDNAAEAQRVLGGGQPAPSSPSIERAEAEAEVLRRLPALPEPPKKQGKRRA